MTLAMVAFLKMVHVLERIRGSIDQAIRRKRDSLVRQLN